MATKTLDPVLFDAIITSGETHRLRDFFADSTELERSALAKTALAAFRKWSKPKTRDSMQHRAAMHAALVTASADEISDMSFPVVLSSWWDLVLLRELRPSALRQFGDVLLKQNQVHFQFVRILIEQDLCDVPSCDEFVMCYMSRPVFLPDEKASIESRWEDDRALRAIIWRFFEVEGRGENSLAAHDKYVGDWAGNLRRLCEIGALSRERLLDESLHALNRGFEQFRAGWHSRFHESMKPTIDERLARVELYGRLLGSSIAPTVSFALSALREVDAVHPLSIEFLSVHLPPALNAKAKATASGALELLQLAAKRDPAFLPEACTLAILALSNESIEVQKKALDLIERGEKNPQLADYIDLVSPSVRPRLLDLVGTRQEADVHREEYVQRSRQFGELRLEDIEQVEPIPSVEELVLAMASVLENPDRPMEIERVLDGVSRLVPLNRAQFDRLSQPAMKRAAKIAARGHNDWDVSPVVFYLARFYLALQERQLKLECASRGGISPVALELFNSVLSSVASDQSIPCLMTPTHQWGWISPEVYKDRLAQYQRQNLKPSPCAQEIALCRVPPNTVPGAPPSVQFALPESRWSAPHHHLLLWQSILYPSLREEYLSVYKQYVSIATNYVDVPVRQASAALFTVLSDHTTPYVETMWYMLSISLFAVDTELSSYGRDALISLIDNNDLDIDRLAGYLNSILHSESVPNRLAKSLSDSARISSKHTNATHRLLQATLHSGPTEPKNLAPLLECLHELLVADNSRVTDSETISYLRSVKTQGKTKKLIDAILAR